MSARADPTGYRFSKMNDKSGATVKSVGQRFLSFAPNLKF